MNKTILILLICLAVAAPKPASAQLAIAEVIKAGVKKVIKAIDLKVQRLQNETIWLQNAQKTLENAMSKLKLQEISGWTERQRDLYQEYFQELGKVKSLISYYHRIKDISSKQVRLVKSYQRAWQLLQQDRNFNPEELDYMAKVYSGILEESLKNIDQVLLVVSSFQTKMTDGERLSIIRKAADEIDQNYYDLQQFSRQNVILSLSRAKDANDASAIKKLYGIN
ncbi:MAG: conjugal transfer protein TraI [Bacteroidota bacterium]